MPPDAGNLPCKEKVYYCNSLATRRNKLQGIRSLLMFQEAERGSGLPKGLNMDRGRIPSSLLRVLASKFKIIRLI
ncbi:MAG: hypothetical protein C0407_00035 [Desulfobacca sp.]|nr:hypothetical protein [Desulfobacca sp.]